MGNKKPLFLRRLVKEKPLRKTIAFNSKGKRITIKSTARMHDKAWEQFSIYIRQRGANKEGFNSCITCSLRLHWKDLHAGHFRHNVLDFDEINLNAQCPGCNTYRAGKLDIYGRMLTLRYGHEVVELLHQRADLALKGEKLSYFHLEEIFLEYKKINECSELNEAAHGSPARK